MAGRFNESDFDHSEGVDAEAQKLFDQF